MGKDESNWESDVSQFQDSLELAERESVISNILFKGNKQTNLNNVSQFLDIDINRCYLDLDSPNRKNEIWKISKSLMKIYKLVLSYQAKKCSHKQNQSVGMTRCNNCFNYIFVRTQKQHQTMCLGALAKKDKKKLCFVCMDELGEATFCSNHDIKKHLLDTHPGVKVAHCHLCSYTTYQDEINTHNEEKHYMCSTCKKPFKYKKEILSHQKYCQISKTKIELFPYRKNKKDNLVQMMKK